mgnify:FL=1
MGAIPLLKIRTFSLFVFVEVLLLTSPLIFITHAILFSSYFALIRGRYVTCCRIKQIDFLAFKIMSRMRVRPLVNLLNKR